MKTLFDEYAERQENPLPGAPRSRPVLDQTPVSAPVAGPPINNPPVGEAPTAPGQRTVFDEYVEEGGESPGLSLDRGPNPVPPSSPQPRPGPQPKREKSTFGSVIEALDWINRIGVYPWYGAARAGLKGENPLPAIKRGFTGEEKTLPSQFLRDVEKQTGYNPMRQLTFMLPTHLLAKALGSESLEQGARTVEDFAADIAAPDVFMGLFKAPGIAGRLAGKLPEASRITQGLRSVERAPTTIAESAGRFKTRVAGSPIGKAFFHGADYGPEGERLILDTAKTRDLQNKLRRQLDEIEKGIPEEIASDPKQLAKFHEDLYRVLEGETLFRVSPGVMEAAEKLRPLGQLRETLQSQIIAGQKRMGLPTDRVVKDPKVEYWPRRIKPEDEVKDLPWATGWMSPQRLGSVAPEKSRKVYKFVDPDTGAPIWHGNPAWKHSPVKEIIDESGMRYYVLKDNPEKFVGRRELQTYQAQDLLKNIEGMEYMDPISALGRSLGGKISKARALKLIEDLTGQGKLIRLEKGAETPEGLRRIEIPTLKDYAAPRDVANMLESQLGGRLDPGTYTDILSRFLNLTKIGKGMQSATQTVARNLLGLFAPFYTRNVITNPQLMAMKSPSAPLSMIEGARVALEGAENLGPVGRLARRVLGPAGETAKIPGRKIADELRRRDVLDTGYFEMGTKREPTRLLDLMTQGVRDVAGERAGSLAERAVSPLQRAMAQGGKAIDYALGMGQRTEDQAKAAQALDFIKRNADKYGGDFEKLFDDAARAAQRALFNYSERTPFEKSVKTFMPFFSWARNVIPAVAEFVITRPSSAGRWERMYELLPQLFGFRTLNEEEQANAPDYIRRAGMIMKDRPGRDPLGISLASYTPFQTPQDFLFSPGSFLLDQVASHWKAPYELMTNWDLFRKRPIDYSATGPGGLSTTDLMLGRTDVPTRMGEQFLVPPYWKKIFQASPLSRYEKDIWNPVMKLAGLGDPSRPEMSTPEILAAMLSGFRAAPQDPTRWAYYKAKEGRRRENAVKRALNYAKRKGDIEMMSVLMDNLNRIKGQAAAR